MTTDEVKAWLRSYRLLKAEIDTLENEIAEWKSRAARLTQSYSGMPSGSGSADQIPSAVERIMELEEMFNRKVNALVEERHRIETAVALLTDKHRHLIHYRYIDCMTWEQVAVKMNLEYRWVLRVHGRALQELSKLTIESHP